MDVLKAILAGLHSGQIQLAVNKQSKNGWSPLIVAASKGHVEAVKVNYITSLKKVLKISYSRSALNNYSISYSVELGPSLCSRLKLNFRFKVNKAKLVGAFLQSQRGSEKAYFFTQ